MSVCNQTVIVLNMPLMTEMFRSTPEVCELSQLTMFYKINRNWYLLCTSAGKLYYSEYIVSYSYNVTGNGERDMHSERMPVMARKYTIDHMWKR